MNPVVRETEQTILVDFFTSCFAQLTQSGTCVLGISCFERLKINTVLLLSSNLRSLLDVNTCFKRTNSMKACIISDRGLVILASRRCGRHTRGKAFPVDLKGIWLQCGSYHRGGGRQRRVGSWRKRRRSECQQRVRLREEVRRVQDGEMPGKGSAGKPRSMGTPSI